MYSIIVSFNQNFNQPRSRRGGGGGGGVSSATPTHLAPPKKKKKKKKKNSNNSTEDEESHCPVPPAVSLTRGAILITLGLVSEWP